MKDYTIELENGVNIIIEGYDLPYPETRDDPGMPLTITDYYMTLDGLDVPVDFASKIFDKCEYEIYEGLVGYLNERD